MDEQVVKLSINDKYGKKWGTLIISAITKFKVNCKEHLTNSIHLINVPIIDSIDFLDDITPIQYLKTNNAFASLLFLEETKYQIYFESTDINADFEIFPYLKRNNKKTYNQLRFDLNSETLYKIAGSLNFRSYVGKTFLDIRKNNVNSIRIPIEVRSKKIGYFNQFSKMIADLSQNSLGILFDFNSPLYQEFELSNNYKNSYYEYFMFLEFLFREENLPQIFEYLSKHLYSRLMSNSRKVSSALATNIKIESINKLVSNPANFVKIEHNDNKLDNEYFPIFVEAIAYEDSIDIPENRFFKYFLELIYDLIKKLLIKPKKGYIYDKLKFFQDEISYYLSFNFFNEISSLDYIPFNSQVLQKKEGYREIFNYYLMFQYSFYFKWNEIENNFKGYEKKLSDLYEFWCYFKLLHILNNLSDSKIEFEDIFSISQDNWSIYIKKGINSKNNFKLTFRGHELLISSFYNRLYSEKSEYNSYSLGFIPDYSLFINTGYNEYLIHFDAKYKSELEVISVYDKINENHERNLVQEIDKRDIEETKKIFKYVDIYKMHTYKDSIFKTEGAYVLYPGDFSKAFFEGELCIPSVGAISLTPGNEKDEEFLSYFLKRIIESILDYEDSLKSN